MKKIVLSLGAIIAMNSMAFAGGDIAPVPVVVEEEEAHNFYLGIALSAVSNRDSSVNLNFSNKKPGQDRTGNVTLLAGYDLTEYTEYLAIEGRYTTSFTDEDKVTMDSWGIFLKPKYTFEDDNGEKGDFTIYGLVGFGNVNIDGKNIWLVDVDDTGFQWGLGASYDLQPDIALFVDYTSLADNMNGFDASALVGINKYRRSMKADVDALTVGITYRF